MAAEAYNNFYYGGGYNPFAGDIRDSIAAIWSRSGTAQHLHIIPRYL
jgi:hypothetical protein